MQILKIYMDGNTTERAQTTKKSIKILKMNENTSWLKKIQKQLFYLFVFSIMGEMVL